MQSRLKKRGFTLIEVTLVIVLISILILITTPLVSNLVSRVDLNSAHESLYNALIRAQQLSKIQYRNQQWRVCINNSNKTYTITAGTCSSNLYPETFKINSGIEVSSEQTLDIQFTSIEGKLNYVGNIIKINLTNNGVSKYIIINKAGVIDKSATTVPIIFGTSTISGTLVSGYSASSVSISVPYTNGTVQSYSQQTSSSTGVTGLTATLNAGNIAIGAGSLNFNITGTPTTSGIASFQVNILNQILTFTANVSAATSIVTNGLVLHLDAGNAASYPGTGTTWTDLSGNNNNGTLLNGVGYNSANGGSLVFDGSNQYVNLGPFFTYQNFTISLWVYPGSTQGQYADIFDNNHTGFRNFVSQQNDLNTNQYGFGVSDSSGGISGISFNLTANVWTHLTFTFTPSDRVIGYINGQFHSQGALANNRNILYQSQNLSIARWSAGGRHWNGRIAHFSAYNRVLTSLEIQQNFNATKARFGL